MMLRIKSVMWNIRKQKTPNQDSKKKNFKNKDNVRSLLDNYKPNNTRIMGVLEGKKNEKLKTYLEK